MAVAARQLRHWNREEYLKMGDAGVFAPGERVELIEGEIITMTPQKSPHSAAVRLVQEALRGLFGAGFDVRPQLPLALGPDSEPEPDCAVVRGSVRDYVESQPTTAVLAVEVADSTLDFDRGPKGTLYAKGGIPEYWIVNLIDRVLEVYRDPGPLAPGSSEFAYRSVQRLGPSDSVAPLGGRGGAVRVADLLP